MSEVQCLLFLYSLHNVAPQQIAMIVALAAFAVWVVLLVRHSRLRWTDDQNDIVSRGAAALAPYLLLLG
jgi:Ca2+/Na+ antiporter